MKVSGMLHVDQEFFDRVSGIDSELARELYDTGHLLVVEIQDRGWAVVDPYPQETAEKAAAAEAEKLREEQELERVRQEQGLSEGQPLGGDPVQAPPGAFGNLG